MRSRTPTSSTSRGGSPVTPSELAHQRSTWAVRARSSTALDGHAGARRPGRPGNRWGPRRRPGAAAHLLRARRPRECRRRRGDRPRHPGRDDAGKNADAVAELTIAFLIMLARRLPEVIRYVEDGGEFAHDNYEGANWFGHDLAGKVARTRRIRPGRSARRHAGAGIRHAAWSSSIRSSKRAR